MTVTVEICMDNGKKHTFTPQSPKDAQQPKPTFPERENAIKKGPLGAFFYTGKNTGTRKLRLPHMIRVSGMPTLRKSLKE